MPTVQPQAGQPPFPPALALVSGVLAVSTGAIFARLATEAPPLVVAAYRVGLAVVLLAPFGWCWAGAELRRLGRRDLLLGGAAGLALALHFATWIASLEYTSVANSVVLVNTNPLWVGILTPAITGERLNRLTKVSLVVGVAGGVVIAAEDVSLGIKPLWGDALALMGGVFAACYLLLGRRLRRRLSLFAYVILCYGIAAIFLWLGVLVAGLPLAGFSGQTYWALAGMAVISQVVGHSSYNWALRHFSASLIAVTLLGEPIGASILAYFLFGEGFTAAKVGGGGLILVGIYLAARAEGESR